MPECHACLAIPAAVVCWIWTCPSSPCRSRPDANWRYCSKRLHGCTFCAPKASTRRTHSSPATPATSIVATCTACHCQARDRHRSRPGRVGQLGTPSRPRQLEQQLQPTLKGQDEEKGGTD